MQTNFKNTIARLTKPESAGSPANRMFQSSKAGVRFRIVRGQNALAPQVSVESLIESVLADAVVVGHCRKCPPAEDMREREVYGRISDERGVSDLLLRAL
jgi:hypothetical protein